MKRIFVFASIALCTAGVLAQIVDPSEACMQIKGSPGEMGECFKSFKDKQNAKTTEEKAKEKADAQEMSDALNRVMAATTIGVSFSDYAKEFLNAKATYDRFARSPGAATSMSFAMNVESALRAYGDAARLWSLKMRTRSLAADKNDDPLIPYLMKQYPLVRQDYERTGGGELGFDSGIRILFGYGSRPVKQLNSLVERNFPN